MTTARKDHLDATAVAVLLACSLFWGFQQVLVKATLPELPPVFQAGLRLLGASLLLAAWARWRGLALWARDGTLWPGLLAGALFAAEFACIYLGLQFTTASRLTVFLYTAPFWVAALLPLWVRGERLRPPQWLGLALAFAGVLLALRESLAGTLGAHTWRGDALALAAGLLWGLTTVTIRTTRLAQVSAAKVLLWQLGVGGLALPLLSLALGERWRWDWSPFAATSMLLQTAVGAFASYLAWMWLLTRYPATKMSVFVFLTPVFALVIGALWLREPVSAALLGALALVAAGIVAVNRRG